jgi:hypothetical protein
MNAFILLIDSLVDHTAVYTLFQLMHIIHIREFLLILQFGLRLCSWWLLAIKVDNIVCLMVEIALRYYVSDFVISDTTQIHNFHKCVTITS